MVLGVVGACLLAVLGWRLGDVRQSAESAEAAPIVREVERDERLVVVHVVGQVARPGLVTLPEGARVADAVIAAGGLLGDAATDAVNLAAPVVDGQQVVIGVRGEAPAADGQSELVALNSADAAELEELPGVGPVLAGRIVAYRDANGPFEAVEDLLSVSGIGERMLASIRDLVRAP